MLLVFSMIFTMLPVTAFASDEVAGGACGENLTWTLDAQGVLTISGEGEMADYSESSTPWQDYREQILEVIFQDHIASVSARAFDACTGLTKVTFHSDAPSFGEDCFCGVSAVAYYPAENDSWDETVRQNYGGELQWIAAGCDILGHTEVTDEAIAATCTESGLTEGTHCSVCGEILTAQEEVAALGHDWDEGVLFEVEGIKTFTCKNNSDHTYIDEIVTDETIENRINVSIGEDANHDKDSENGKNYKHETAVLEKTSISFEHTAATVNAMTSSELEKQVSYSYSKAKELSGKSSFNGLCATMVEYQLVALGINEYCLGGNGNDQFDNYKNRQTTTGGYHVTAYPSSNYSISSTLNLLTQNGTKDAYNILVGFTTGSGDAGKKYGHVVFINGIIDGIVYFCESFNATIGGKSYAEGAVISCSISTFANYYNAWTTLDGLIHFTNGYLDKCKEFPSFGRIEITKSNVDVMSLPCSNGTDSESVSLETANKEDRYVVTALILNDQENYWYRVKKNQSSGEGYIYAGNTSWLEHAKNDTKITVNKAPTTLYEYGGFYLDAEITATYNSIYSVASYVYPGTATSGNPKTGDQVSVSIPTHSYTIAQGTELDNATKFSTLPVGDYTYCIKVSYISYYATSGTTKAQIDVWGEGYTKQFSVLNAEEKPVIYTITLNSNGGSDEESSFTVLKGNPLGTLPEPSFEDMSFEGWYTEPFGGGTLVTENTVPTGDMTLYAHYTYVNGIKLEFDPNGGWIPEAAYTETLDGINRDRLEKELIVYQDADRYWSNQYGKEVAVSATGKVIDYRGYDVVWDEAFFPDGGFVLSGQYHWDSSVGADVGSSAFIAKIKTLMDQGDVYVSVNYETGEVKVFTSYAGYLNETKRGQEWTTYGTLPIPVRDGYVFGGWDVDGSDVYYDKGFSGYQLRASWSEEDSLSPEETIEYNGHRYELYDHITSWTKAKALCEDMGGHLVTITDVNEQTAILGLMESGKRGYYLIGATNPEQDETWNWVTGETFSYNYWDSNEPSCDEAEFYAGIIAIENPPNKQVGDWIDTKNEYHPNVEYNNFYDQSNTGFICEFDSNVVGGTCGDNLTWNLDSDGVLTISGTGEMTDNPWSKYLGRIKQVDIGNGITSVCNHAFEGSSSLNSVSIPNSVTKIGEAAFGLCVNLSSVDIPQGVTVIEMNTFRGCQNLTDVVIPEGVTVIGTQAFNMCYNLTEITIPASVAEICFMAFDSCTSLQRITFEGNAPQIGQGSFGSVNATACYPAGNETWTEAVKQQYGGTITWVSYSNCDKVGHSYSYKLTQSPTEVATGMLTGTCANCTGTTTLTLPKLNTTDYSYQVTKAATCTAPGTARYTWKTTTYGSFYFDVTLAKAAHSYTSKVTAPTCTAQGYTTYTCTCGDTYKDDYVNALGHSYTYKVSKNPTEAAAGTLTGTCSRCSGTTTVTLPKLNTTDYTYQVTKAASCTATGTARYTWKTTTYGSYYFDVTLAKTAHSYTSKVTAPTCTEQGYTTHTCSGCGDNYKDSYVNATGHKWDSGKVTTAATCTKDGVKTYTCTSCSTTKTEAIAATGHSYSAAVTKPTCTEKGYTTHTCSCGDSYVDTYVDAAGHKWDNGVVTKEPTEKETGIRTFTCTVCKETRTEEIPTLEHKHVYTAKVTPPTCTEKGYTTHTCSCGDSYVDSYVDAIGHKWDSGKVTTAATCTEDGVKTYTCATCSTTKTETIAAAGHKHEETVTTPTCTEKGYTTHTCSCGDIYVDTYVNALGHTFENGYCTRCGAQDPYYVETITGNCGDNLTWTLYDGTLTISGTGAMSTFDRDTQPWAAYKSDIRHVIVEDGVTSVSEEAFYKCTALETVVIADSVTAIGNWAFSYCASLTDIDTGDGITQLGSYTFMQCTALRNVTLSNNLTIIGDYAFRECIALESIILPEMLTEIDIFAFAKCEQLVEVTLPKSLQTLNYGAFMGCTRLKQINVEEGNTNYCSVEGVVYNAKMTILVAAPGGWEGAFIIPEGVLMIGERAFQLCNSLYEVSIPDTVSSIQSGAFMNCDGLTRIVIPASIDLIETSAFSSCDNLTEILFLGKAPAIRNSAFEGVIATVYYPVNKSGWTSDVMQQYGGTLTWIANDPCAEGHTYGSNVTAPTCTEQGYTTHSCSVCGNTYKDSYVDATGHKWDSGKVTTAATCTKDGVKTYTCTSCFTSKTETVAATGHKHEATVTAPTCTEKGYTTHTCSGCGDSYVDTYVDALGHDYKDGICSVCGESEDPILASGTHGSTGTWVLTKDGTLTISGTGNMGDCGNIKRPWMDYRLDVKKVIIEEGITDIGTYAFYQFHNLEVIEIPSTVKSIKEYALNWCKSLRSITLPDGLVGLQQAAITQCQSLERLVIPESVTYISKLALAGNTALTEIYFEGDAPSFGERAFEKTVTTAYYPANNETWTPDVMQNYSGTITWIPYGDVHEHTEVIDAAVEPTCTETGLTGGKHCSECGEILIAQEEIPALGHSYENGICTVCGEADPNYSTAVKIASGWSGDLTWVLTDDGVLAFSGTGAMKNYGYKSEMPWYKYIDQITSVVLNEGVTRIGDYAFYGMTKLETIDIADTVTYIGDFSFKGSTALDGVVLPPNLSNLGTSSFYGCTGLTSIEIPASLYTVKPYAFKNCSSLAKVTFHEGNLMKLSDGSFYGTALTELEFPKCLDIIDVYCFKNCFQLATITIPEGDLTQIREAVFYATAIPSITIPEGVTKVGPYAFKNCVNLKTVSLPTTLTSVGEASFYACTGLQGITIPDAVTSIGDYAFRKCAAMTEVNLGRELTDIGLCAFYGCSGLTNLEIPDKVTTIQGYAFKGCTGLTDVTLGSSVETLGESAFHTCTALKTLELPASLKTIGDYCFSGSYNLWQLTFTGNAPSIGSGAFKSMAATACYPANDSTWTSDVMQNYGGSITWKAVDENGNAVLSVSEETELVAAEPEEIEAEVTEPEATIETESAPEDTITEDTVPEQTETEVTEPEATIETETAPEDTITEDTAPEQTETEVTEPEATTETETSSEESMTEDTVSEETEAIA